MHRTRSWKRSLNHQKGVQASLCWRMSIAQRETEHGL